MTRTLLLLCAAATLVAPVAVAAPKVKGKDEAHYFPTRVGDKRDYEIRSGDRVTGTFTDVVTQVEKADRAMHVTIRREYSDAGPAVITVAAGADGVFRIASNGRAVDPPDPLLKLPAKVGTKWNTGGPSGTTYEVTREEEVEVPAGKYKALRVEASADGRVRTILWFAPGLGLVKMTTPESEVTTVLKAFTPGK